MPLRVSKASHNISPACHGMEPSRCSVPLAQLLLLLLLVMLVMLVMPVRPQHYYTPRQLHFYEAPRLRRLEYAYVAPPAAHYQQQTPNFQLLNYRPSYQPLAVEYQQQQLPQPQLQPQLQSQLQPQPAGPLPGIYPQPSVQYLQRSASPPAELAKYRYEGNYMPVQHRQRQPQARLEEQLYNVPPALFTSDVLHVVPARAQPQHPPPPPPQQQPPQQPQQVEPPRSRRFADAVAAEARAPPAKETKTKYFHDIFMRFDGPDARSHGHVLEHPQARQRRFETQRGTNRYRGEVIWTDRRGGHGEHRWDLAQGKL